ncbi:aminoglycoside phosphotransferase family protein [Anaeromyxobacter paludicola]|uniref:Cell wall phosphotransferase n=1 Tax=Anaeromyxobacter paludicola TaxID=2918171 RepID=A0ABN6ND04_9BACT|nr:phosphotransferase [Anaeromyxobacter paludicola]BDG10351.1 cell wall phosphotransferase [Anaeromyxobacter paludicola]
MASDPVTTTTGPLAEARVREALRRHAGAAVADGPVQGLGGHASLRTYWRARGASPSLMVMVMPPGAKPEEATQGGPPAEEPFVNVQRYLARIGVRVPRILAFFPPEGALAGVPGVVMILEDLGDDMLETRLLAGDDREKLYEAAVDQLARLRAAAEARPDPACVAFGRRFDQGLYRWELDHFREWLLEAWKGASLAPDERAFVDAEFDRLSARLAAEPLGFTHRDYQSRNLMVLPGGEQAVLDFQDALLGPRQYDLVALLRDSYVELPADLVERMLRRWLERFHEAGGPRLEYGPFRELFDLLTVQRKLKDAGRFVFIDRVKKNPGFLVSIPASLRYVRDAFGRLPELAELRGVLGRHVPELLG